MRILAVILLITTLAACDKEQDPFELEPGYDYFPVDSGRYWIYDVDSVFYNANFSPARVDSFHFQLKEVIGRHYKDLENREAFFIHRYKRTSPADAWVQTDVWWGVITATYAERAEEDVHYVKLVFPVKKDQSWNGHARNSLGHKEFSITESSSTYKNSSGTYTDVLKVLQEDDENLIEKIYGEEKFSKKVGLVYKKRIDIKTNIDGSVKSGVEYEWNLTSTGK